MTGTRKAFKKKYYKKKGKNYKTYKRMSIMKVPNVYSFKREWKLNSVNMSDAFDVGGAPYLFPYFGLFTAMENYKRFADSFNFYRINGIKITVQLPVNFFSNSSAGVGYTMHSAIDHTERCTVAPTSISQISNIQTYKKSQMLNKPVWSRYFKPKILQATYSNGSAAGFASSPVRWLSTFGESDRETVHTGMLLGISWNGPPPTIGTLDIYVKFYFQMKELNTQPL